MEKTYTLPDGTKFIFEYDHNRMGIITLECMDTLMSLLKATAEQTEPQTEAWHDDCNTCRWHDGACTIPCCDYEPKTEPQTAECPFDDSIPCEWVCTEYGKCKYKPKDEPQTVISYTSGSNSYGEQIQTDSTDCSWK